MKKKQLELIQFISEQNKPLTGNEIATFLDISSRTVKNYIKEINETYDKNIIISSRYGYEINPNFDYSIIIDKEDNTIPQSFEERTFYIIKRLYSSHGNGVNIFELADELYIGYSTLKNIIAKMNKNFDKIRQMPVWERVRLHKTDELFAHIKSVPLLSSSFRQSRRNPG